MIAVKKLAFEKKNLSSEEYHARLLQKINNIIGDKNGVMKPNQLAQSVNNAVGIGSDGSQIFKEPIKHIFTTRINYQVVDETTILVDLPLIFIDFNWHSVFNSKVSELKDEEIVLPFPDCIFKITYLDKQPVIHARQSSETFKITLDILSDDTELDVAEIKQHILAACLSIELNLVTLPPTAKINLNIKKKLEFKGISYVLLPVRKTTKTQPQSQSTSTNTGTKQRLHIRRGHWKTIRGIKKRIKWYIAGDITLGIIIKDYKID